MDLRDKLNEYLDSLPYGQQQGQALDWLTNAEKPRPKKWRSEQLYWLDSEEKLKTLENYLFEEGFIEEKTFAACFALVCRSKQKIIIKNVGIPKGWTPCDFREGTYLLLLFDKLEKHNFIRKRRKKYVPLIEHFTANWKKLSENSLKSLKAQKKSNGIIKEKLADLFNFIKNL